MKKMFFSGVMAVLAGAAFAAEPKGYEISPDYTVTVDGKPAEVIRVPTPEVRLAEENRHPYSYAPITVAGPVEIAVESKVFDLAKAVILPASKKVKGMLKDGKLVFKMYPPQTLILETNGRHGMLVLSASKPVAVVPNPKDPKVKYFGPGVHRPEKIFLRADETLYLAPGAYVEGIVVAQGDNITLCGSGILSGAPWPWRKGPKDEATCLNMDCGHLLTLSGNNLKIRDITAFSSFGWTTVLNNVTNAVVENYKIISGRCVNDDGMDISQTKNVTVRNAFIRVQDDCIAPKWAGENLVVSNCTFMTDESNIVRIGYECNPGQSFKNFLFKDIDVLHLAMAKRGPKLYWSNCAMLLQGAREGTIENVTFDDWRIHEFGKGDVFFLAKTMSIKEGRGFTHTGGWIRNVTVKNPTAPVPVTRDMLFSIAKDPEHGVEGVRLEYDASSKARMRPNQAIMPAPRKAGDWMPRHERLAHPRPAGRPSPEVVLLGDSITHFWAGKDSIGEMDDPKTKNCWKTTFKGLDILDFGIAGDRTQTVLWRLDNGELKGLNPKVIGLMIGINNSWSESETARANTPEETVVGVKTVLARLREMFPHAEIIVSAVLPSGKPGDRVRSFIARVNEMLALLPECDFGGKVRFVNWGDRFLAPDGTIPKTLMYDLTHPTDKGYEILGALLRPEIDAALKRYEDGLK